MARLALTLSKRGWWLSRSAPFLMVASSYRFGRRDGAVFSLRLCWVARIPQRSPPWCSPSEPAISHAPIYIPARCLWLPVSCTCACLRFLVSLTANCSTGLVCRSCCSPPPPLSVDGELSVGL